MPRRKQARPRSKAARAAYAAGVRHGQALAKQKRHRQAVAAGKKSGQVRREKAKQPKVAAPMVARDSLVLYEASLDEAAPLFVELQEWPIRDAQYLIDVQLLVEGVEVARENVALDAVWENDTVGRAIRRQVRAWYDTVIAAHPGWNESPRALALKLTLALT